jgi:hypothetical protein
MSAMFTYTDPDMEVTFQWHGGAYIDIGHLQADGEFIAHECINVWDYATDTPTIARTLDAFEHECREWLAPKCDECDEPLDRWGDCPDCDDDDPEIDDALHGHGQDRDEFSHGLGEIG